MEELGIFNILSEEGRTADGHKRYRVQCKFCNGIFYMKKSNISAPKICKHFRLGGGVSGIITHWANKRLGNIFASMKDRCYNRNNPSFKWYGEKGICVCEKWLNSPSSFEKWAFENGYTDSLTIDRVNPNLDYCPENCRWVTMEENSRRAGNVNWITVENTTMSGKQWSLYLGVGKNWVNRKIRKLGKEKVVDLIKKRMGM